MYKHDIGINAGVIWTLLSEKGALSMNEMVEFTEFKEPFFQMSLGWLIREGKIRFFEQLGTVYVELDNKAPEIYY